MKSPSFLKCSKKTNLHEQNLMKIHEILNTRLRPSDINKGGIPGRVDNGEHGWHD